MFLDSEPEFPYGNESAKENEPSSSSSKGKGVDCSPMLDIKFICHPLIPIKDIPDHAEETPTPKAVSPPMKFVPPPVSIPVPAPKVGPHCHRHCPP